MSILDGGTVSEPGGTTPLPDLDPANSYGVTVDAVRELVSHIYPNPSASDPHFGSDPATPTITDNMIASWINRASDSVRVRVAVLAQYSTHPDRWAAITGSARTAVLNRAAAYVVDAAFPHRAATNDQSSLAAVYRDTYREELEYLTADLPKIFADQDAVPEPDAEGRVGVPPLVSNNGPTGFPEGLFHFSPYRDPYLYPPAPGTERR